MACRTELLSPANRARHSRPIGREAPPTAAQFACYFGRSNHALTLAPGTDEVPVPSNRCTEPALSSTTRSPQTWRLSVGARSFNFPSRQLPSLMASPFTLQRTPHHVTRPSTRPSGCSRSIWADHVLLRWPSKSQRPLSVTGTCTPFNVDAAASAAMACEEGSPKAMTRPQHRNALVLSICERFVMRRPTVRVKELAARESWPLWRSFRKGRMLFTQRWTTAQQAQAPPQRCGQRPAR